MIPELPLQVLVADGDPAIQHLLAVILQRQGWQVTTVGDGQAALEHLCADLPDVLLIDLILPRRSGLDVLQWIDKTHPCWLPHVIVLTAAAQHVLGDLMKVHTVGRVIRKPFEITDLVSSVEFCGQRLGVGQYRRGSARMGTRT